MRPGRVRRRRFRTRRQRYCRSGRPRLHPGRCTRARLLLLTEAPLGTRSGTLPRGWQARRVPFVDLMDESFVVAEPGALAARLRDPSVLRRAWPGLELVVFMDRGDQGIRWSITGDLVGSCEIWLEPFGDGVIVHYFLRADPTRRGSRTEPIAGATPRRQRRAVKIGRDHAIHWKAFLHAVKDGLEAGRPAGEGAQTRELPGAVT